MSLEITILPQIYKHISHIWRKSISDWLQIW